MFLKMFFKDLKNDKGLNVVLLLFMMLASVLMVVGAICIYAYLTPKDKSLDFCKVSDAVLRYRFADCQAKERTEYVRDYLLSKEGIEGVTVEQSIQILTSSQIDVEGFEEDSLDEFFESQYSIDYLTSDHDLMFDLDDKPFEVVGNGIAVNEAFRDITGVELGDSIYISTDSGKVFRFVVTHFYKDIVDVYYMKLIVARDTFEQLQEESYYQVVKFGLQLKEGVSIASITDLLMKEKKDENHPIHDFAWLSSISAYDDVILSSDMAIMYIIVVFSLVSSVFMIVIILMTIRFTLVNAIENEKKELGMMKAMGADTVEFRFLFAAKYIGFAIISGIFGIFAGRPVAKIFLRMTYKRHIFPSALEQYLVATLAIVFMVALMVGFTVLVLRRINKISVMEVIHGQGKGETYKGMNRFFMYKTNLSVPFYLALSDLRFKWKKYIFLVGAYICAFLLILCTTNLRDSVYDVSFLRYTLSYNYDFHPNFNEELSNYYYEKAGDATHMIMMINDELEKAGIPAGYEFAISTYGDMLFDEGRDLEVEMLSDFDANKYIYREGKAPVLRNEIAMSYRSAQKKGLNIGDTVKLKYKDYSNPMEAPKTIEEEFVITAFLDYMESFFRTVVIMSNEFHNGFGNTNFIINISIYAPEEEKPYYFEKIEELFGPENIDSVDELMRKDMGQYDTILTAVRNAVTVTSILVIVMITLLYGKILISAETPEIAALKSSGFTDGAIKKWQIYRGMMLLIISTVLAYIIHFTAGQLFISVAFLSMELTGFKYVIEPMKTFVVIPTMIWVSVMLVLWALQKNVEKIQIWKIRED